MMQEVQGKGFELRVQRKKLLEEMKSWESCKRSVSANIKRECESRGLSYASVRDAEKVYEVVMRPIEECISVIDKELEELQKQPCSNFDAHFLKKRAPLYMDDPENYCPTCGKYVCIAAGAVEGTDIY